MVPECSQAFKEAKTALVSSKVLVHYDLSLPVTLAGDASTYGIGSVISHTMPDGSEHPKHLLHILSLQVKRITHR